MGRSINQLPLKNGASLNDNDELLIQEAGGGVNKKTRVQDIKSGISLPDILARTAKTTLAATDVFLVEDNVGGYWKVIPANVLKVVSLTEQTTVGDTDELLVQETADGAVKKALFSTLKSQIVTTVETATINEQTGVSYTIAASDSAVIITTTNGAAVQVTLPSEGASLPVGFQCSLIQRGAGQVEFILADAVNDVIESKNSYVKTNGQHSIVYATLLANTAGNLTWGLYGDLGV